jgi:hypothetical protein
MINEPGMVMTPFGITGAHAVARRSAESLFANALRFVFTGRGQIPLVLAAAALAIDCVCVTTAHAQARDVSGLFPEPARVTADFPDDAERYAAFSVLYQTLAGALPSPMSKAAYDKDYLYEASYNAIATQHLGNRATQPTYAEFNAHWGRLLSDPNFSRAVLEKYHLTQFARRPIPRAANPPQGAFPQGQTHPNTTPGVQAPINRPFPTRSYPIDDSLINNPSPFPGAFPILALTLIPMAFVTWLVLKGSGTGTKILLVPPPQPGGLPPLPENLRVVSVPGVRFSTFAMSGMVLKKETNTCHHHHSYTTGGQVQQIGNVIHTTPLVTSTSVSTTKEHIYWIRTPDGQETPWTFKNSGFQAIEGHIISAVAHPYLRDTSRFLLAYNHTTGELDRCQELNEVFRTFRPELSQWLANLVAAAGAALTVNLYLPMHFRGQLSGSFLIWWLVGTFVLVTISFFLVTPRVTRTIQGGRYRAFERDYLPDFQRFLEAGTAVLRNRFK